MSKFNFDEISDKSKEGLAQDLLNQVFGLDLQPFSAKGKKGPDLWQNQANSPAPDVVASILGQTKITETFRLLKKMELHVQELKPLSYLLVAFSRVHQNIANQLNAYMQKLIAGKFEVFDLGWIETELYKYPDIQEKWGVKLIEERSGSKQQADNSFTEGSIVDSYKKVRSNITSAFEINDPKEVRKIAAIENLILHRSSDYYWWLNVTQDRLIIEDFNVDSIYNEDVVFSNLDIKSDLYNLHPGDLVIGFQASPNREVKGLFEVYEIYPQRNQVHFKLLYKFTRAVSRKKLEQLPNFDLLLLNSEKLQGNLWRVHRSVFEEIINSTELSISTPFLAEDEIEHEITKHIKNKIKLTGFDNDVAYSTKDLLDIENDIRAFALLLASRQVQPPLAIALLGPWGSGKSFFMQQLSKRIDELSVNQAFVEDVDPDVKNDEEPFCKGIAQIKFNAWSYLDANLWAGLVASIFEKLDEYITNSSKGKNAKLEIRQKLSEKLEILSTEKKITTNEKEELQKQKQETQTKIDELKQSKQDLLDEVANKNLKVIIDNVRKKVALEDEIKVQLNKYGISKERINELSPDVLYKELTSWVTFYENLSSFSWRYILAFFFSTLVLLFVWFNPWGLVSNFIDETARHITIFFSIVGPVFAKFHQSYKNFRKLIQPVIDYKNRYNQELEEAKFNYDQRLQLLETQIKEKSSEMLLAQSKLNRIDQEITDLEYTLNHFVAKRAFYNFIKRRNGDKTYEAHLGLISIIRKDFETLSELFRDIEVDVKARQEVQNEQKDKKKEHDELTKLFKKPLDRIILYIDDLDRCTDTKVLEVIQAVHLLMAFPLFNVVVGIDKRCVYNALNYKQQAPNNFDSPGEREEIKPDEYLEKIFQIPFQLKDATEHDAQNMVKEILKNQIETSTQVEKLTSEELKALQSELESQEIKQVSDNEFQKVIEALQENSEPGSNDGAKGSRIHPKDLRISNKEYELLQQIICLVGNTPRTIKRFINIYRIIRAHEQLRYDEIKQNEEFLAIMFVLAVNLGKYREQAHFLFKEFDSKPDKQLSDFLERSNQIKIIIEKNSHISELLNYTGSQFNAHVPFVRRFSFGGVSKTANK
ncbi:hypothetical protein JMN32_10635 [Fulvivirga sp. 29W222]|uniref:KAP NTPase domain-containing protein n=1 Tax=Fulvivirga marina TaxID=2494733 RepID=A0A937FV89_9BACT|nr:P-loop NTPase fold protein [Fulvivirga marina]MBL6446770.1 hypothetical protein [Fulvivirga marina]